MYLIRFFANISVDLVNIFNPMNSIRPHINYQLKTMDF